MFQANYKDTRVTLTETFKVSFLLWTLDKFLFPGVFSKYHFIYMFKNFKENIWRNSFMEKQLPVLLTPNCLFCSFLDVYKKGLLKNFLKLTRKHLYRSLYLSLCFSVSFKDIFFIETLGMTASESSNKAVCLDLIIRTLK